MSNFYKISDLTDFSISALDTAEIEKISNWFPRGGVIDINSAERGMILSLHGQNVCQEHIVKIDIWIGYKEAEKNKAWMLAIGRAKTSGHGTVKDKEWFAQADEEFINACNELTIARAAKKYFENKASNFSGWHYAFKTFLGRDYSLERLANFQSNGYNRVIEVKSEHHPADKEASLEASDTWGDSEEDNIWK